MAVTTTNIANRALLQVGYKKVISSLSQDSPEAQSINEIYTPIVNWCFGISNWNFARQSGTLTLAKGPPSIAPGVWSSTYPPPPWLYEYTLPVNFIRAIYMTNQDNASINSATAAGWIGEPKRYVIANDTVSATVQPVLLTNESAPILVYTGSVADPTQWPWYFERLTVLALAVSVAPALTQNPQLVEMLSQMLEQQISIATQINQVEGLEIPDTTPEWTQALGISYPYRRLDGRALQIPTRAPSGAPHEPPTGRSQ